MRWARGAAAVAVALLVMVGATWLLGFSATLDPLDAIAGRGAEVEVPDLTALSRPRAVADVESAGLVPEVSTSFSVSLPRGAVISQDPEPGTVVREGSEVQVVVSRGVLRVDMPDAVGRPLADVVGPLEEAGVEYTVDTAASEDVVKGIVIKQSPAPGRKVTAEDQVVFLVSAGPEPRAVPAVAGLATEGAAYALGGFGFAIGEVVLRNDPAVPKGVVISTDPPTGEVQPRDTPVDIVVSDGPPPVVLADVVGQNGESASAALTAAGLVPDLVGGGLDGGVVATMTPAAGTTVPVGSVVRLEAGGG